MPTISECVEHPRFYEGFMMCVELLFNYFQKILIYYEEIFLQQELQGKYQKI